MHDVRRTIVGRKWGRKGGREMVGVGWREWVVADWAGRTASSSR